MIFSVIVVDVVVWPRLMATKKKLNYIQLLFGIEIVFVPNTNTHIPLYQIDTENNFSIANKMRLVVGHLVDVNSVFVSGFFFLT